MIVPETCRRRRLNSDSTLRFLLHEIGCRLTVVDLTRFVNFPSELEDPLSGRGLAGINVCEDANVAVFSEVCHDNLSREGARHNHQPTLLSSLDRDFLRTLDSPRGLN